MQKTRQCFLSKNPFNNDVITHIANCGAEETKMAIDAANEAFKTWKKETAGKRSKF